MGAKVAIDVPVTVTLQSGKLLIPVRDLAVVANAIQEDLKDLSKALKNGSKPRSASSTEAVIQKASVGRTKPAKVSSNVEAAIKATKALEAAEKATEAPAEKKKRGRPAKAKTKAKAADDSAPKKKRGRPKKQAEVVVTEVASEPVQDVIDAEPAVEEVEAELTVDDDDDFNLDDLDDLDDLESVLNDDSEEA